MDALAFAVYVETGETMVNQSVALSKHDHLNNITEQHRMAETMRG